MKRSAAGLVRLLSRLVFVCVSVVVLTLVSIQFARIVGENIAMAQSLASVRHDVRALDERTRRDRSEMRRLLDPQGAVPAIHQRLHLVAPGEAIIYVKRASAGHP